jgi:hypothetical protein
VFFQAFSEQEFSPLGTLLFMKITKSYNFLPWRLPLDNLCSVLFPLTFSTSKWSSLKTRQRNVAATTSATICILLTMHYSPFDGLLKYKRSVICNLGIGLFEHHCCIRTLHSIAIAKKKKKKKNYHQPCKKKKIYKEKKIGACFKKAVKNWFLPQYKEFHSQQRCVL